MVLPKPRSLTDRLLLSFPAGHYGLTALLRVVRIEESTAIPTACMECARRPRLLINPDFVRRHAETPGKLLMLVMHELHHLILGHTRRYPRTSLLQNFIFDAVINAMLCWLLPLHDAMDLLRDFYRDDRFPECLLRPVSGWRPGDGPAPVPPALRDPERAHFAEWYQALYSRRGLSYSELREALEDVLPELRAQRIVLLGDHGLEDGSSSAGHLDARSIILHQALAGTMGRWRGGQQAGGLAYTQLRATRIKDVRAGDRTTLSRLLRRIGGDGGEGRRRARAPRPTEVFSGMPGHDRRSVALRSAGVEPLIFRHELAVPGRGPAGERVHVYFDVSGSMSDHLGHLYGAIVGSRKLVHPMVHLFSTEVADVRIEALGQGACLTTKGTRIHCVARHMREHRVRRAVVVTDGCVGALSRQDAATLRAVRLGVALTPGGMRRTLEPVADAMVALAGKKGTVPIS